jgi:CheY-like chemotaxis protein/HPt (histidine-containing phosphotransfer) domain-containing protein
VVDREHKTENDGAPLGAPPMMSATDESTSFLATASHEIRAPLHTILGMSELLAETSLSSAQRQYIETLRKAADGLLHLLDDVLDFSRLHAGAVEVRAEPFSMRELVERTLDIVAVRAHNKRLELTSVIDADVPLYLVGDGPKMQQVLLNLLNNAIKYTPSGEVALHVAKEPGEGLRLRLSVRDTGPGLDSGARRAIFDPFVQLPAGAGEKREGVGLGLAICRRLVELLGGALDLDTAPGRGSTFWFTAPVQAQDKPLRDTRPPAISVRTLRFLIVDDSEAVRRSVAQALAPWNPHIEEARTLADARTRMAQSRFDVVFIDADADNRAGFAYADELLAPPDPMRSGERSIAPHVVLMLHAHQLQEDIPRAEASRAQVLVKPVKTADLYRVVERAFGLTRNSIVAQEEQVVLQGLRVLAVDDSPDGRLFLSAALSRAKCSADVCADGASAFAAVQANDYALILMDIELGANENGRDVTRQIRAFEAAEGRSPVPILALTAHSVEDEIRRCFEAGCTGYVGKPVSARGLIEAVSLHARRPAPAPQSPWAQKATEARMALLRRDYRALELLGRDLLAVEESADLGQRFTIAATQRDDPAVRRAISGLAALTPSTPLPPVAAPTPAPASVVQLTPRPAHLPSVAEVDAAVAALLPEYLQRRRDDVAALRTALAARDFTQIASLGHRMAGSGATFGLPRVTELGAEMEQAGNARDPLLAGAAIEGLAVLVDGLLP